MDLYKLNIGFFKRFDTDHDGCVSVEELRNAINSDDNKNKLPQHIIDAIFEQADVNNDGRIDLQEFMAMIKKPENEVAFGTMKKKYLQYMNFVLPPMPRQRMQGEQETMTLSDQCSCWPPPIIMVILSVIQISIFIVDYVLGYDNTGAVGPVAEVLIYDPARRIECWRFITYMFVHLGSGHLVTNMVIQTVLGTLLESVHRGHRIMAVYLAGVLLGSLWTSLVDPGVKLAGASGGVYSLITAHIATIIINWSEMQYPFIQLAIFTILTVYDLGFAIRERYMFKVENQIGYAAHFFGALAGLLVGIRVLRNIKVTKPEIVVRRITFSLYLILVAVAILVHLVYPQHFLPQKV